MSTRRRVKQRMPFAFWAALAGIFAAGEVAISFAWGPWYWKPPVDPGAVRVHDILGVATIDWIMICVTGAIVWALTAQRKKALAAPPKAYAAVIGGHSTLASPPARRLDRLPPELAGQWVRAMVSISVLVLGMSSGITIHYLAADVTSRLWIAGGALAIFLGTYVAFSFGSRALAFDKAAYGGWATERAWHHRASAPEVSDVWEASPFGRSEVRGFRSSVSGTLDGRRSGAGVYLAELVPGVESSLRTLSVAFARIDKRLPCVDVIPRTVADGVDIVLGGTDIRVESAEFNARWRVVATHAAFAHAVVHPRLMERLLADDAAGRRIRVEGETVAIWQPGLAGTHDLEQRLRLAGDLADLIPQHVLRQYGDAPREALFRVTGPSDRTPRPPLSRLTQVLLAIMFAVILAVNMFFIPFS